MSDQAIFTLNYLGIYGEEGKKNTIRDQSGSFFSFIMMVHQDQADTNCNHSRMICKACVKLSLDLDGVDDRIDSQILTLPHIILFHLVDLENGRKPYIGIPKKERGYIFS